MDANLPLTAASQAAFPWLSLIVLLPAAMALLMPLLPGDDSKQSTFAAQFGNRRPSCGPRADAGGL
jgi:NAD(P)H-quinone oxidoreductase subunit 4